MRVYTVNNSYALQNQIQGFPFLQKRGFYGVFHETPVHLDSASFNPGPYASLEANLRQQGIMIKTLCELETDPGCDRKIQDLYCGADGDLPQEKNPL